MAKLECVGQINIQKATKSDRWEMVCGLEERAVWGKNAEATTLELNLLGRRYVVMLDENIDDPESGRLFVEPCDPTEDDLDAINDGLQRIADEANRELKASAVGLNWRFGLLWIEGSDNYRELQVHMARIQANVPAFPATLAGEAAACLYLELPFGAIFSTGCQSGYSAIRHELR